MQKKLKFEIVKKEGIKMRWYPKEHFEKVEEITIEFLQKNKIKVLILDVDNTLIDYHRNLSESIIHWVGELKQQGIKLYILSNTNQKEKVEEVANRLEIPYRNLAKKPFKKGFLKIQQELKEEAENIGVVRRPNLYRYPRRKSM